MEVMKEYPIIKKWLEFAKGDLRDAQILFENKSYQSCIFHCHQSTEKLLKAIICAKGKKIKKVHDLADLLKESEAKYTPEILDFINELNPYYNPIRYPDAALPLKYDRKTTRKLLKLTKDISKWFLYQLKK